jgi:hypothetical protein
VAQRSEVSNKKITIFLSAIIVLLIVACGATARVVNSFEECVAARLPVAESHPRKCYTPDGKHFVEALPSDSDDVACTMDAMQCMDGTYVSRVSPSCKFAPCPRDDKAQ